MKTNSRMMLLFMTMVSANFAFAQTNLLPNGDFSATAGITGWIPVGTGSLAYFSTVDADNSPASGAMVLRYLDGNDPEHAVSECFPVTAGASYLFGGKAKDIYAFEVLGAANMTCSSFSDTGCSAGGMTLGSTDESSSTSNFASWIPIGGVLGSDAKAAQCTVSTIEIISPLPATIVGSGAFVDDLFFTLGTGGPVLLGGYLSGSWYDPTQSGQGFQLEFTAQDNTLLATWYTYSPDASGTTQWVYGQGNYDPARNSVTIPAVLTSGAAFSPNFVAADVKKTPWGNLTFAFADCDHATMSWNSTLPGYGSGTQQLRRLTSIAGLSCPQ